MSWWPARSEMLRKVETHARHLHTIERTISAERVGLPTVAGAPPNPFTEHKQRESEWRPQSSAPAKPLPISIRPRRRLAIGGRSNLRRTFPPVSQVKFNQSRTAKWSPPGFSITRVFHSVSPAMASGDSRMLASAQIPLVSAPPAAGSEPTET